MALLQIRDVPEEARRVLKSRAAARGLSLNAYVLELIAREVRRPTVADVIERASRRSERLPTSSANVLDDARKERDETLVRRTS